MPTKRPARFSKLIRLAILTLLSALCLTACKRHQTESDEDYAPTSHDMSDADCSRQDVQDSLRHAINVVLAEESRKVSGLMRLDNEGMADTGWADHALRDFLRNQRFVPDTLISAVFGQGSYEFSYFHGDGKVCYVNVKVAVDVGGAGPTVENEPVSYTVLYVGDKPAVKIQADSMRRISRDLNATRWKTLGSGQ